MIQVLIVDDHPIVREGLQFAITEAPDIQVVGEATNADQAMVKARECKPDVIVLDISLPGRSGLDVLSQLHDEMPETNVLMLSTHPEKQYAIRCLKSGARGYMTKGSASKELVAAIRKVSEGKKYVSEQLAELLASEVTSEKDQLPHERLTDRELGILALLVKGKSTKEMSNILSLSASTVSTHRSHILAKMQLASTAELVQYAIEHKLLNAILYFYLCIDFFS